LPELDRPDDLLLAGREGFEDWKMSGIYLDLGFVNMAIPLSGRECRTLWRKTLALAPVGYSQPGGRQPSHRPIYLNALTKVPFHAQWARDYLRRLQADPSLSTDKEITHLRNLMVKRDLVGLLATDEVFGLLLDACPQNRMAFEYHMIYCLLTKNLPSFANSLKRVQDFPGFEIPPLWQEALIIFSRKQRVPAPEIKARFNPDLVQRGDSNHASI